MEQRGSILCGVWHVILLRACSAVLIALERRILVGSIQDLNIQRAFPCAPGENTGTISPYAYTYVYHVRQVARRDHSSHARRLDDLCIECSGTVFKKGQPAGGIPKGFSRGSARRGEGVQLSCLIHCP
jgi:hypothetical protein